MIRIILAFSGVLLVACTQQPKASSSRSAKAPIKITTVKELRQLDSVVVQLNNTGNIRVEGELLPMDSLQSALQKARFKKGLTSKFVFIVSSQTQYQRFIEVQGVIETVVHDERLKHAREKFDRHYEKLTPVQKQTIDQEVPLILEERTIK